MEQQTKAWSSLLSKHPQICFVRAHDDELDRIIIALVGEQFGFLLQFLLFVLFNKIHCEIVEEERTNEENRRE